MGGAVKYAETRELDVLQWYKRYSFHVFVILQVGALPHRLVYLIEAKERLWCILAALETQNCGLLCWYHVFVSEPEFEVCQPLVALQFLTLCKKRSRVLGFIEDLSDLLC